MIPKVFTAPFIFYTNRNNNQMHLLIKIIRVLLGAFILFQALVIINALVLIIISISSAKSDFSGVGALLVVLVVKFAALTLAYIIYRILGKLKANTRSGIDAGPEMNGGILKRVCRSYKLNAQPKIIILIFIGISIGIYHSSSLFNLFRTKHISSMSENCTTLLSSLQERFPNAKNYTAAEMAELLSTNSNTNQTSQEKYDLSRNLTECSWHKFYENDLEKIYLKKDSVRILPENRRVVLILHDFVLAQKITENQITEEYNSIMESVVVACEARGFSVIERHMMSHWFGTGQVVWGRSADIDPRIVALVPVARNSPEYFLLDSICKL